MPGGLFFRSSGGGVQPLVHKTLDLDCRLGALRASHLESACEQDETGDGANLKALREGGDALGIDLGNQ